MSQRREESVERYLPSGELHLCLDFIGLAAIDALLVRHEILSKLGSRIGEPSDATGCAGGRLESRATKHAVWS